MLSLLVPRVSEEPLHADASSAMWRGVEPVPLCDVVTAAAPVQGTTVRVAATPGALRVLFHAQDRHAWATLTKRDAPLYTEEVVEVFVDPVGDLAGYFEIEVNPLNAVLDLLIRRNRKGLLKDFRWQCEGLETRVEKTDAAWTAELSLPWAGLSTEAPKAGTRWRANFCRIDRPEGKPRELSAWSPTGQEQFHVPAKFGELIFA